MSQASTLSLYECCTSQHVQEQTSPVFDIPLRLIQLVYLQLLYSISSISSTLSTCIPLSFCFYRNHWKFQGRLSYNLGVQGFLGHFILFFHFFFSCLLDPYRMTPDSGRCALLVPDSGYGLSGSWAGRAWQEFKD